MRIAVCNPDHIGDFVLRQPMLAALAAAGHELLIIVRALVAPLAAKAVPAATILQYGSNPYAPKFHLHAPLDRQMAEAVVAFDPDLFVVAAYQHTQLEEQLAAMLPRAQVIAFDGVLFQNDEADEIVHESQFRNAIKVPAGRVWSEVRKNELLCGAVLGKSVTLPEPHFEPDEAALTASLQRLADFGLQNQRFWVVCAGESSEYSRLKNWPLEKWAELCSILVEKHGLYLVFIGSQDEHESTVAIRKLMGPAAGKTLDLTAEPEALDKLLGLLSLSDGYLGKDTGPMHLAAAVGKPVVAVFGGGTWPRFVPQAKSGGLVTVRVPCSDCNWHCPHEVSHCVKDVPLDEVLLAVEKVLRGESAKFELRVLDPGGPLITSIAREASNKARTFGRMKANFHQWHTDRLTDIEGLKRQLVQLEDQKNHVSGEKEILSAHDASLERQIAEVERQREKYMHWHEDRKLEIDHLQRDIEARQRDQAYLQARFEEVSRESAERQAKIQDLQTEQLRQQKSLRQSADDLAAERAVHGALLLQSNEAWSALTERFARSRQRWSKKLAESQVETADLRRQLNEKSLAAQLETTRELQERSAALENLKTDLDTALNDKTRLVFDWEHRLRRRSADLQTALDLVLGLRSEAMQSAQDIDALQNNLQNVEGERDSLQSIAGERRSRLEIVQKDLDEANEDRERRLSLIETLSGRLREVELDRAAKQEVIDSLIAREREIEADRAARLRVIEATAAQLAAVDSDRNLKQALLESLTSKLEAVERDRADRGSQIDALHLHVDHFRKEISGLQSLLPYRFMKAIRRK